MARNYQRPVDPLARRMRESTGETRRQAYQELRAVNPGVAEALHLKFSFSAQHHRKLLELDDGFLKRAHTEKQSILELGAGNGRLAGQLIHNRPNIKYTIFDKKYATGIEKFPLNREVRRALRKGKVKAIAGDFYEHDFGSETWRHILLPASFFCRPQHTLVWGGTEETSQGDLDRVELVKKLLAHVKKGGTLRASHLTLVRGGLHRFPKLRDFLQSEQDKGNITFRVTETETPPSFPGWLPKGTLHGIIITRLR